MSNALGSPSREGLESLPRRLMPSRSPPFLHALAVTAIALATAIGLRVALLGFPEGLGASSTFFPAFIAISLYAGARWGWGALVLVVLFSWFSPWTQGSSLNQHLVLGLFAASGAVTVAAALALREALVRVREEAAARTEADAMRDAAIENLRESEKRFRALADSAPALLWLSVLGGARDFVNTAYVAFVGGTYEDALHLDWRTRLHPDDLQRILREQVAGESSLKPFVLEARYRRGDGEWRWLRSFSQPRFDPSGAFLGFAGIAFDVTDAKQVEADLQRINDLLAERVDAAVAERDEAQAALAQSQKLEALGQLTGGVAHDFNNLLTVITGALDIVQRHPEDAPRTARLTRAALDAAQRGERLTRQLLAFSRRQPLRPEVVVADELIRECETLYGRALGERFMLDLDLGAPELKARIDPGQFDAAMMNLLVNARDAMEGGGVVTLSTRIRRRESETGGLPSGEYLAVAVRDNGAGMDEATKARVFEPFFSTKPVGKGTGLGLSQVYGFVRQSGGSVTIDSDPGQGTTVTLLLPVTDGAAEPADADQPGAHSAGNLTVVLVEDEPAVAALAEAMLRELGHEVHFAETPTEALELLRGSPRYNLLLTDLVMPGDMSGVDLAQAAVRARPGLPVLLSSGYTGEVLASAEDAPWPLLRKPYTLDMLAQALDEAVESTARQYENG